MPQFTCPVCGGSFYRSPYGISKTKGSPCCSRECKGIYLSKPKDTTPKRPRRPKIKTVCANCGITVTVGHSRFHQFERHFCSHECAGIWKTENAKQEIICDYCGNPFIARSAQKNSSHTYCSYECFNLHRLNSTEYETRIEVPCAHCATILRVHPVKFRNNKNFYCNIECRKLHIQGENNPAYVHGEGRHIFYGKNWKSQRRKALERDSGKCQHCGKCPKNKKHLHVHHITKAGLFETREDANNLQNLITLCKDCHNKAEKGEIISQRKLL